MVAEEVLSVEMPHNLAYMNSAIVKIKRCYQPEENDDFAKLAYNYAEAQRLFKSQKVKGLDYDTLMVSYAFLNDLGENIPKFSELYKDGFIRFLPGTFINKWVKKFNIGSSISMKIADDNVGIVFKLHKDEQDKRGRTLAGEGYGISQLFAIMLRIETAIMEGPAHIEYNDEGKVTLIETQRLSLKGAETLKERMRCVTDPYTIALEEPEVHLHPRFQSLLADMIVDAYKTYNVHFIVETHSEYLIRKLQTLIGRKDNDLKPAEVSIIYVYPHDKALRPDGEPQVKVIEVEEDGTFATGFGSGFFDEADSLALELMQQNLN